MQTPMEMQMETSGTPASPKPDSPRPNRFKIHEGADVTIYALQAIETNYIYMVHAHGRSGCVVIDPSDAGIVNQALVELGWLLDGILVTHPHQDHVAGVTELCASRTVPVFCANADFAFVPSATRGVSEGELINIAGLNLEAIAIPGHTRAHIAWYLRSSGALFVGDTLFAFGCGRIFDGSAADLYRSLQKIARLPLSTRLFFGHEYAEINAAFAQHVDAQNPMIATRLEKIREELQQTGFSLPPTLAEEVATNPFLRTDKDEIKSALHRPNASALETFVQLRSAKDSFKS
jgi:hydroxyacylglutathione hydrolase